MGRVLVLVQNTMTADARVDKQAASLAAAGYEVDVVAIHHDGLAEEERRDGYRLLRIPFARPSRQILKGPALRLADVRRDRKARVDAAKKDGRGGRAALIRLRSVMPIRRVAARVWYVAIGAVLVLLGNRAVPWDYWRGTAKGLVDELARPDVIHAHNLPTLAAAVRLARCWSQRHPDCARPAVVYDSHELYTEQRTPFGRFVKLLWTRHERRWIRHADLVVTVSDGIADQLRHRYRLPRRPMLLLNTPSGLSTDRTSADARTDAGVAPDRLLAVYVGQVKKGRGIESLVGALHADDSWHLALVGPGESRDLDALLDEAGVVGVADRIHVLPSRPWRELASYISTADVGVHPLDRSCLNHELALPNKLFDYVFAGLPVAVSRLPEMTGLVEREQLGAVFDPDDPEEICRALRDAATRWRPPRPELLHELAWPTQARRLLDAYARLTTGRGTPESGETAVGSRDEGTQLPLNSG